MAANDPRSVRVLTGVPSHITVLSEKQLRDVHAWGLKVDDAEIHENACDLCAGIAITPDHAAALALVERAKGLIALLIGYPESALECADDEAFHTRASGDIRRAKQWLADYAALTPADAGDRKEG